MRVFYIKHKKSGINKESINPLMAVVVVAVGLCRCCTVCVSKNFSKPFRRILQAIQRVKCLEKVLRNSWKCTYNKCYINNVINSILFTHRHMRSLAFYQFIGYLIGPYLDGPNTDDFGKIVHTLYVQNHKIVHKKCIKK